MNLPATNRFLWLLALALWIGQPFQMMNYVVVLSMIAPPPPQHDAIAIPIIGGFVFALLGLPVWVAICHSVLRDFPARASLLVWAKSSAAYSWLVSGLFGGFVLLVLYDGAAFCQRVFMGEFLEIRPFAVAYTGTSVAWALLWVSLRACCVAKRARVSAA